MTASVQRKKGDLIELTISDLADGQKCFGRLEDGLSVFVQGPCAVGDQVEASIFRIKSNYLEARLTRVLTPSPVRQSPVCPYFGSCGGCKWQHVQYGEQLRVKHKLVADALKHLGGFSDVVVHPVAGAADIYQYRNKMEFSFGARRYLTPDEIATGPLKSADFALGFHAAGRFDKVLDLDHCHIATAETNLALETTRRFALDHALPVFSCDTQQGWLRHLIVRQGFRTGQLMVNLVTSTYDPVLAGDYSARMNAVFGDRLTTLINSVTDRKSNVSYTDRVHVLKGDGTITEKLGRFEFVISPYSFFQTNTAQAERLYDVTKAYAGLTGKEVVYDLFCGTGSIAIYLSDACQFVAGFELEKSSVADARINAEKNAVGHAEFIQTDMKNLAVAMGQIRDKSPPDVIVTDPPRAGMHTKAVETVLALAPRRIVYVSCNPASLARDAQLLCAGGAYRLVEVQPVDLFPHTYHIESVARLERSV